MIRQLTRHLAGQGWPTTILAPDKLESPVPRDVNLIKFPLAFVRKFAFIQTGFTGLTGYDLLVNPVDRVKTCGFDHYGLKKSDNDKIMFKKWDLKI